MIFDPPLVPATLLRRSLRFLVDVQFTDGSVAVAHCTNTGRMTGCATPGAAALVAPAPVGRARRLAWTLRLVRAGRVWVNVDTGMPNRVVVDALRRRRIPELAAYDGVRPEVPYGTAGRSRVDVLLTDSSDALPPCYVEVKNVTLREGRTALFPDAPTERGRRHLRELAEQVRRGNRAVLIPFVARGDCDAFAAARAVDPAWADALLDAAARGVLVLPLRARVTRHGIALDRPLPWDAAGLAMAPR